ncbi:NADH-quinone oxidoreductase subunit J, partial [candidate division CSSED10-310 bacterium]
NNGRYFFTRGQFVMSLEIKDILFFFVALFTIGHAMIVVFNKNLVRSAFALLFCFLGVAGLYVFAGADFIAVIQVMVYVGGISILFLFAIMLTSHVTRVELAGELVRKPMGIIVCIAVGAVLAGLIYSTATGIPSTIEPTTTAMGNALLDEYLLPFEIVSVLLIMALIGAVVLGRAEKRLQEVCEPVAQEREEKDPGGGSEQ